jgi:WD40 repeat protein
MWSLAGDQLREELALSGVATGGSVASVAFSPDGEQVMASNFDRTALTVWDVSPVGGAEWVAPVAQGVLFELGALAPAPDGRGVVAAAADGGAEVVDVESGGRTTLLEPTGGDILTHIGLSADGQRLAVNAAGGLDVIDIPTQRRVGGVSGIDRLVDLAWSDDGTFVVAVVLGLDGSSGVVVLDRDGSELSRYEPTPDTAPGRPAVSPDGRLIAFGHRGPGRDDPTVSDVTVWDWRDDEVVATIRRDETAGALAFDPTGTLIVAGSQLGDDLDVWDVASGERKVATTGVAAAADVTVSPDGSTIATSHADGVVRLWDARTGVRRLELPSAGRPVSRLVFTADGSRLAALSYDGLVRLWAVDLDDLVDLAERRVTRPLSDDECRQYLHLDRCPTA